MANQFLQQIKEDIQTIQNIYGDYDTKLENDWYAFNYWVLNYLYHIDIEDIPEHITEYNDKGIDCFVHFEDSKELYIIQNFYYSDSTNFGRKFMSDFLISPLHFLSNNLYTRSKILQDIFNSIKNDEEYIVYLYCYTTKSRNTISKDILSLFDKDINDYKFNVETKLFDIDKLEKIYHGERYEDVINFEYNITLTKKHIIEQLSEQHDKVSNVNTIYAAINVFTIYSMLKESFEKSYDLFDKNIREFLGIKGKKAKINKGIQDTLLNDTERNRFFYYNNGITIICNDIKSDSKNQKTILTLSQPQIVNGCQTTNTIYQTIDKLLKEEDLGTVVNQFRHSSILVKIFKVDKSNDEDRIIYENIVRYTNTQTSISAKDFAGKDNYFLNLQKDFLARGFYLIVKQSDKYKFETDVKLFKKIRQRSNKTLDFFDRTATKPSDLFIDLDKLLKCLCAFYFDGYVAFTNGSCTLHENSSRYYTNFSKQINNYFSTNNMINLYLTFYDAGGTKVRKERFPIPYYVMDFMSRGFKNGNDGENFDTEKAANKLSYLFSSKDIYKEVFNTFKNMTEDYNDDYGADYNIMIKQKIDIKILNNLLEKKINDAKRYGWNYLFEYMS